MTQHLCDLEFPWCPPGERTGDIYKLRVKDLSPTQFAVGKAEVAVRAACIRKKFSKDPQKLLDRNILAGKHTFDDVAFEVDEKGALAVTDDGKEVLEEAVFLATSPEVRGLPGFRGSTA